MRLPRLLIGLILGLVACLAAGLGPLLADETTETTGPVDPGVVTLQPGENLVGWLGEPLPIAQVKQRLPAIESVSAWEPLTGQFYEPASLLAGQGYIVTLAGTEAVQWRRPMMPVKGKVTLHRGRNLVTWLGPDDWAIDRVALGIGRALVRAEWEGGEYTPAETTTAKSLPALKRGAAIWVEVSRTVNWLQPAGVMPTVVFAGEIAADIKATVGQDSIDIMNWFAEEFGVQPDGSMLSLYIATDPDLLVEAMEKDGHNTDGIHRTWYRSEGWADESYVVQKAEQWRSDHRNNRGDAYGGYTYGRRILAHEYYHTIQLQMGSSDAAIWLVEGDAQWVRARFVLRDTKTAKNELAEDRQHIASEDIPPLKVLEIRPESHGWEYTLGTVASHQLAIRSGLSSLLDFWRALLAEPLGPLGRWQTNPPWQAAFHDVFGISVDDFYSEFAAWRSELAPVLARGRVVGPEGAGLPYVKIVARTEHLLGEGGHSYFETSTDGNGEFELAAPGTGGVQWGVDLGGCAVYYTSNGAVYKWEDAELLSPSAEGVERVSLALTDETCVWRINGRVVDRGNVLPANQQINVDTGYANGNARIGSDGTFSITVPVSGVYLMRVYIDECGYYYNESATSGSRDNATDIVIADSDVDGIDFVISETACSAGISGRLLDADGQPMSDVWVNVRTESSWGPGDHTDADGAFDISIADSGRYFIQAQINGCWTYYRRGSTTPIQKQAARLAVDDDVTRVVFKLSPGQCSTKIAGTLLEADGAPITNTSVWIGNGNVHSSTQTDASGAFVITAPEAGRYRVTARIDGCHVYYRNNGVTGKWASATLVRVSDVDLTGLRMQLDEGMCVNRILGKLLNADGSPRAGEWVHAEGNSGSGGGESGADGSFSMSVTTNGTYRLSVGTEFGDCRIRYRRSGPTKVWESATGITISNKDVSGIEFRLPADEESFCR